MAGNERDDVEMDIEEVMGLIESKREQQGLGISSLPPPPDPHSRLDSAKAFGALESKKALEDAPVSGKGDGSLPNTALNDDLYDPLAGVEAPPSFPVSSVIAKQEDGANDAMAADSSDAEMRRGFHPESGTFSDSINSSKMHAAAESREHAKSEGSAGERREKEETGGVSKKVMALAGLLEQYEDEESELDEEGEVSAGEQGSGRVASDHHESGQTSRPGDERGENSIKTSAHLAVTKGETEEKVGKHPVDVGKKKEGAARSSKDDSPTGFSERRDEGQRATDRRSGQGGEADARHSDHAANKESVHQEGDHSRHRRSQQDNDVRKPPDGHRREREPFQGTTSRKPSQHRQERGDRDRSRDRGDRERPPDRRTESGSGRHRESDDRRRDNVPFRGLNREARDRGGHLEPGRRGPREEKHREGGNRDTRQRHNGPRDRRHERSPRFEERRKQPDAQKARDADAKPESKPAPKNPDSKPDSHTESGAKAGSTGANVDLNAAVAAAAAAAARSAKLAASRAPPPPPTDPAEAVAKAAEMVNKTLMIQNAVLQQKRKMLWGDKKATPEEVTTGGTNRWDAAAVGDSERTHKFQKLMGLKTANQMSPPKVGEVPAVMTAEKQQQMQAELERQYAAGLRRRDGRTVGLGL